MKQGIIVLYVNDVGQRLWAGPFWDERSAVDFQVEMINAGAMTAACNTRADDVAWVERHGGVA